MSVYRTNSHNNSSNISPQRVENPIAIERGIDEMARMIIALNDALNMNQEDRSAALADIMKGRVEQLTHVPVNGLRGGVLFLNMKQIGLAPSPLCPYYRKMQFPTVSTYGNIGSNIAAITLSPEALQFIPQNVLAAAGNLNGKQVDLLWTAIDGRFSVGYSNPHNHPLNLCTHTWAHNHALPYENVRFDVQMGIFPEIGFTERNNDLRAIAINGLSPMDVHAHDDLYSPDNAHFERIPNSPFGVLWSVTQKDNRVAITKLLVLFDYDHPICLRLINTIRNCSDLNTHMNRLENVQAGINETFALVLEQLQNNNANAMRTFENLPPAFQYGIFQQAFILKGSRNGIHGDFGRASFLAETSLNAQYHCSKEERIQAIGQFKQYLYALLVGSQDDLLCKSQPLVKGDNVLRMMQCAELFDTQQVDAARNIFFNQLSQNEQRAVYLAAWELSGCPQTVYLTYQQQMSTTAREELGIIWGTENLMRLPRETQSQALLLAASRQIPVNNQNPVQRNNVNNNNNPEIAVNCNVGFGNTLGIRAATNWNENIRFRFENGQWRGVIPFGIEFKFVRIPQNGDVTWEQVSNRTVQNMNQAQNDINTRSIRF